VFSSERNAFGAHRDRPAGVAALSDTHLSEFDRLVHHLAPCAASVERGRIHRKIVCTVQLAVQYAICNGILGVGGKNWHYCLLAFEMFQALLNFAQLITVYY
jgi:hypothetical protein